MLCVASDGSSFLLDIHSGDVFLQRPVQAVGLSPEVPAPLAPTDTGNAWAGAAEPGRASWRGRHIFRTHPHTPWAAGSTSAVLGAQAFDLQHPDESNPFVCKRRSEEGDCSRAETDLVTSRTQPLPALQERRRRFRGIMERDRCAWYVATETTRDAVVAKGVNTRTTRLSGNRTEYLNSVACIYFSRWDFLFGRIL